MIMENTRSIFLPHHLVVFHFDHLYLKSPNPMALLHNINSQHILSALMDTAKARCTTMSA